MAEIDKLEARPESARSRYRVIGRGRAGSAIAARLEERGLVLTERDADLVVLCVPDGVISELAKPCPSVRGSRT